MADAIADSNNTLLTAQDAVEQGIATSNANMQLALTKANEVIASLNSAADLTQLPADLTAFDSALATAKASLPGFDSAINLTFTMPSDPVFNAIDTTFPTAPTIQPAAFNQVSEPAQYAITPSFSTSPVKPDITPNFSGIQVSQVEINPSYPSAPQGATFGTVGQIELEPVPVLQASEPVMNAIQVPAPLSVDVPQAPDLPNYAYPSAPNSDMPGAPVAHVLVLPDAPNINLPVFDALLPTPLDAAELPAFNFTEQDYQSALQGALKTKLLSLVLNERQTGLSPAIEQQLWDRAREKSLATAQGLIDSIGRQYSRSGWEMPTGDEAERVFEAMEAQVDADITESRNIAVTQADLEQKNFQFAFTQAIALEGQLLTYHNQVQQRAFEAARYIVESAIQLYNLKVSYFNANVQLYTAMSQVYRDKVQAELSKIEVYKAQLEGQKLIGEINIQDVERYKAMIQAVVSTFDLYKAELEAVKIKIEGDGLTLDRYGKLIQAYEAQYRAKALEYDGYKAQLSGEEIKSSFFKNVTDAFGQRIQAFSAVNDARIRKQDADIKVAYDVPLQVLDQNVKAFSANVQAESARLQSLSNVNDIAAKIYQTQVDAEKSRLDAETQIYKADTETYQTQVDAESKRLQAFNQFNQVQSDIYKNRTDAERARVEAITAANSANTSIYKSQVDAKATEINANVTQYEADTRVFTAKVGAESTRLESGIKLRQVDTQVLSSQADLAIKLIDAYTKAAVAQKDMAMEAMKTAAQVQAQLVAAFGSAVNYSAGISATANVSSSSSKSESTSTSTSGSTSTSVNYNYSQ